MERLRIALPMRGQAFFSFAIALVWRHSYGESFLGGSSARAAMCNTV